MPELPDITVYIEALERRVRGQPLTKAHIAHPFLLRSVDPPLAAFEGKRVVELRRIGKRIALGFEGDLWLILHLMIAGRLHWHEAGLPPPAKRGLAAFEFPNGALTLTEAGSKRRASLHAVRGGAALAAHDRGGLEPLVASEPEFRAALTRENHTLKRALADPTLFSGIGNAYSDEILHAARLSPVALTSKLGDAEISRLYAATQSTLRQWIERLRAEAGEGFPERVTAFRKEMAVHGKYGKPCPACGTTVQRIRYAANETNYCSRCQTGGKLLADRALSRLLHGDWPRCIEEMEEKERGRPR